MAVEMAHNPVSQERAACKGSPTQLSISGWLLKRKSEGARSRIISDTNKRYFTLDFNTQVFFYSKSEDTKQVSYPVAFRDILGVESLSGAAEEEGDVTRQNSKNTFASKVFGGKPKEQHGFILRTPQKNMELICSSAEEAERWIAGLTTACAVGQGAALPNPSGSSGERSTTPGSLASGSRPDDGFNLVEASEPAAEPSTDPVPRPCVQVLDQELEFLEKTAQGMTMMSLSSEMEQQATKQAPEPVQAVKQAPEPVQLKQAPEPVQEIKPSPPKLDEAVAEVAAVSVQEADAVASVSAAGAREGACSAWGAGAAPAASAAAAKYTDRGEGLTLQQRLAQLDFSDDEDEDEPVQAGKTEDAPAKAAAAAEPLGDTVKIEECQKFVAPESDNED